MKNRIISGLIALLMLLAAIPTISAAPFVDIDGHWAASYIEEATALQLFAGVSESEFAPERTMTRAMFVTVLGRLEGINPDDWRGENAPQFFQDVASDAYYAPYISWAVCNGIVNGVSPTQFDPDAPVTREQMAKLIAFYTGAVGGTLRPAAEVEIPDSFADAGLIADWAAASVELLRESGILNGIRGDDGAFYFDPQASSTRAQCAAVFCRLNAALERSAETSVLPEAIALSQDSATLPLGRTLQLTASLLPAEADSALLWHSSNPEVATVEGGLITATGVGEAVISAYTVNGLSASCKITCTERDESLASASETYQEKCLRMFGEEVDDPRLYYAVKKENGSYTMDYTAAKADMTVITVMVWDLNRNGGKYTKTMQLEVHKNIAATVEAIFDEIYHGVEQFPIHYLGGFSNGGRSEHTIGCAIDINPNENYYYNPKTGEQVGEYWKPGEDPYSIPLDGEVAKIFEKYGFRQGAYWNSGTKDYMHFSYFGT